MMFHVELDFLKLFEPPLRLLLHISSQNVLPDVSLLFDFGTPVSNLLVNVCLFIKFAKNSYLRKNLEINNTI